jgi:hypothetical protein
VSVSHGTISSLLRTYSHGDGIARCWFHLGGHLNQHHQTVQLKRYTQHLLDSNDHTIVAALRSRGNGGGVTDKAGHFIVGAAFVGTAGDTGKRMEGINIDRTLEVVIITTS